MRSKSRAPLLFVALLCAGAPDLGCRAARAEDQAPSAVTTASSPVAAASPSAGPSAAATPAPAGVEPAPTVSAAAPAGPCPNEMTRLGKACIDRWEAHLVVAAAPERVHPHNQRPEGGVDYAARSASGVFPQGYINRLEASAACESAGKRLCTLAEWYRACRGAKGATWPYGWSEKRGACNVMKPHLLGKLFGNDPRRWDYVKHFNAPELNATPGWLGKTAEHAECTNAAGTFDMVGNLHEWVSDVVDRTLEQKLPLRDDIQRKIDVNTGHGIFMGGFYSTGDEHGKGCGFVTIGHEPKYHDYSTGFRCCKDPE